MGYKNLMCIGGPKDGQFVAVPDCAPFVEFPVLPEFGGLLSDCATRPGDSIEVIRYRREWLRDFDGKLIEMLLASGVTNPIQRLFAGYKPDSADKA